MDAIVIHPDGAVGKATFGPDTHASLLASIDCTRVDAVRLVPCSVGRPGLDMWIDDDGFEVVEPNPLATAVVKALWGVVGQMYYGTAVLAGVNANGETVALTDVQAAVLNELVPKLWEGLNSELPGS